MSILSAGVSAPFITGGVDSCLAEVLGFTRDNDQVVLRIVVEVANKTTGQYVTEERIFQRDRYTIEGLKKDIERLK
jgi:hypothetical protein